MQYLHIIPPSRRMMDTYIKMLREHFPAEEHCFYFINTCLSSERELFDYGNVHEMTGDGKLAKAKHLYHALNNADIVLWHGLIYPGRFMLFLAANPNFLKKSVWVMWGIDLYNWKRDGGGIRTRLINFLNKHCRCHMKAAIALLETDKDYFQKTFSDKIPCYIVPYPISESSFELMDSLRGAKARKNGKVFIQVAHNAHPFNNHLEILKSLIPYKDENIKLFLPLSYGNDWHNGNQNYIKDIVSYLTDNFSGKAYSLYHLMPQLKYTEFLWNMDIAIFNAERQNALGNILKLLYMGNKVFMTSEGPLYNFFLQKGIEIYDAKKISSMPYEDFIQPSDNSCAVEWIKTNYHPQYSVQKWLDVFEKIGTCKLAFLDPQTTANITTQTHTYTLTALFKPNFFPVDRYLKWPKALKLSTVKDVYIIGAQLYGIKSLQWLLEMNKVKYQWFFQGFLDETVTTFNGELGDYDVVGDWKKGLPNEDASYICSYEMPALRQNVANSLTPSELECFITIIHPNAKAGILLDAGKGGMIDGESIIDIGVRIGDFVHICGAHIECCVHIGNYCNIGKCHIGYGVKIGNNVIIENNVEILPNTTIPDNSHLYADKGVNYA